MSYDLLDYETVTHKRPTPKPKIKGKDQGNTLETLGAKLGNFQPLRGDQREKIPEADRKKEWFNFFSEWGPLEGDVLVRDENGIGYYVRIVEDWSESPIPHYENMIVKIEDQG